MADESIDQAGRCQLTSFIAAQALFGERHAVGGGRYVITNARQAALRECQGDETS